MTARRSTSSRRAQDERQRDRAVEQVGAAVLAGALGGPGDVEDVVEQLEGEADAAAERAEHLGVAAALERAQLARGLEQPRGLEVAALAGSARAVTPVSHASARCSSSPRASADDASERTRTCVGAAVARQLGERLGEQQVAGGGRHQRGPRSAKTVGLAAPQRRGVEDVVVDERRGVDELDRRGRAQQPLLVVAPRARRRGRRAAGAAACRRRRSSRPRGRPAPRRGRSPARAAASRAGPSARARARPRRRSRRGRPRREPSGDAAVVHGDDAARRSAPSGRRSARRRPARRRAPAGPGSAARRRAGTCRRRRSGPAAGRRGRTTARRRSTAAACVGVVISSTTTLPPGPHDARHLAQPRVEVAEVARAEADGRGVEGVVGVGQVARVAPTPSVSSRRLRRARGRASPR